MFPSPMKDFGYDVSDYEDVHTDYGTLADMDRLIKEAHRRHIHVILDFVPNHTSDEHTWFRESCSSKTSPKRDWYIWRDAKDDGSPPNNWIAAFGGPAWEWHQATQQYYLHSFLREQPDLNWRNPQVERAMHNVLRFWMDRGVDGFRIDVMGRILKDPELRDNPPQPNRRLAEIAGPSALQRHVYDHNWPDIIDAVRRIRKVVDEYPERMAVGEVFGRPEKIVEYYGGPALDGLHLAFNFPFVRIVDGRWTAAHVRASVDEFEAALPAGGWPNHVFGNHDVPRMVSRVNGDGRGRERARVAAMLLLTLRGTPFIYYGEELGMEDVTIPERKLQDPARFYGRGRDPQRTPMPWTRQGGFSFHEPWLPYGNLSVNVEDQEKDRASLLWLYRRLIWLRRRSDALRFGAYTPVDGLPPDVYAYARAHGDDRLLIVLNFSSDPVACELPPSLPVHEMLIGTHDAVDEGQTLRLRGNEGRVMRLETL